MRVLKSLGATTIRDDATWSKVEVSNGEFSVPKEWDAYVDQALQLNISPLLILAYGNPNHDSGDKPKSEEALAAFARYAAFVVEHFRGRVHMYEIWNEWPLNTGDTTPGTAADYVRLLRHTVPAIRRVDSHAVIIVGAVPTVGLPPQGIPRFVRGTSTTWLEEMVTLGGLNDIDGISLHPYVFTEREKTPEAVLRWVSQIENEITDLNGGNSVDLYLTEIGWPTHDGHASTRPDLVAAFASRLLLGARVRPFIKGIWWYDFSDDGPDPHNREHHFGLVAMDKTPKPALAAFAKAASVVTQGAGYERVDVGDDTCWVIRYSMGEKTRIVAWHTSGRIRQLRFSASTTPTVEPYTNEAPIPKCAPSKRDRLSCVVELAETPITLEGKLETLGVD